MINLNDRIRTKETLNWLYDRQGGALIFNTVVNNILDFDVNNWKILCKRSSEYKEFSISIYNVKNNEDIVKLVFFVNPNEIVIGQSHKSSSVYTRKGWVTTFWGENQEALTISGSSAGFYVWDNGRGGLSNLYRRRTPAFVNLMDIVGLFKNNGWYFLNGITNPNMFKDAYSRVINVMDNVKIEYNGNSYIGSFNTFTLDDVAESPYRLNYTFEFVVSSMGTDLRGIEGHLAIDDNFRNDQVHVAIQGFDIDFKPIIGLDAEELNRYFPLEESKDPSWYDYSDNEAKDEYDFYSKKYDEAGTYKVPKGVFKITRGWRDGESHNGKCDFRTHTGNVYSATEGVVVFVSKSYSYGGSNYVLVRSTFNGEPVYVRYFHLDPGSITVKEKDIVEIGTILGREGTDGGKYPPHCDFEVRKICEPNTNYRDCIRIEATPVLDNMWRVLNARAQHDEDLALDFKELRTKHPPRKISL